METFEAIEFFPEILPEESECFIELNPEDIEEINQLNKHYQPGDLACRTRMVVDGLAEDFQFCQYMFIRRLLKQANRIKLKKFNWLFHY